MAGLWLSLRLDLLSYTLTAFSTLYPVLQFYGLLSPQSAGLVGFARSYSGQLMAIIRQLIFNFSDIEMQLVSIERLKEYAQDPSGARPCKEVVAPAPPAGWPSGGRLELRDVSVAYRPGLQPALRDVSVTVGPLERVAVVGRTGAGKSTLLKAILQLVPLKGGDILVDDISLRGLGGARRAVAIVPQTPVIFDGSLRLNLDPHGLETDATLWAALRKVGLAEAFVGRGGAGGSLSSGGSPWPLSERSEGGSGSGLDTPLSAAASTAELSAGQRQLLGLARMVLSGSRVLLLDEVTSGLAPQAARGVVEALRSHLVDRTCLVVTHQPELLALCSRFLHVERGCCRWGERPEMGP